MTALDKASASYLIDFTQKPASEKIMQASKNFGLSEVFAKNKVSFTNND